jgi:hypothetical protein
MRSDVEDLKNISMCDLFYKVTLNIIRPLPKTNDGNEYILVEIDQYSKWSKAKAIKDHTTTTTARFLEEDIICRYGVPKFILTDNGGEWLAKFDNLYKVYGIQHSYTTPQWPWCNGMAKRLIKTIKHDITIMLTFQENVKSWDIQLLKVLFGYKCGV